LSDKHAFESWFGVINTRYGLVDNVELQANALFQMSGVVGSAVGPNQGRVDLGIEPALVYNVVDFRFAVEMPVNPDTTKPFKMDFSLGFPSRYSPEKHVAFVGLTRLMTIHAVGGGKPDLTADLGAVLQPLDFLAVILRAQLTVPRFDTT